ncbi:hypothetical protein [Aliidiomarina maris]|uniref:Type VI secretion system VasI family protein n=1 Tax=Aliidiomarina maris TaxID=531312 RepID=A0A327WYT9_9GAMM|nr:hypothetical protein [Aliidiomarina maris]MBA3987648.1 hypothetical protein [Idiomarina sp.]MCL5050223.1 type VI secretion protein [Bacillota bacterium]RAJ98359.1 type VI secretion system VasI family protein [Aliidiomarina maris]RUO24822.1 hypothetical protein CWE07_07185 [Aliidiomarina maris]
MKILKKSMVSLTVLVSFAAPALAQADTSELSRQLTECRSVESALERLDCYDRVTRNLAAPEARQRGEQAREQAQQTRERADDFGREHRNIDQSEGRRWVNVEETWQNAHGLWRFRLDDGSEWHQTQSSYFAFDPDTRHFIERGALNSFRLGQEGSNRSVRVRRVD